MRWSGLIGLWLAVAAAPAFPTAAQIVATSPRPDRVEVTVYRDPGRDADRALNLNWLNGFAMISEVRTVRIPAGDVDIRFEGVAGNILPQSAIVSGLPDDVLEKNHDAYLLSPATLIERTLGRRVHLRRTSRATGEVVNRKPYSIGRRGRDDLPDRGGYEALRCTPRRNTNYDRVPEGLSARPILSVRTRSRREVNATVTLSYLATGFDWQANYVANLSPDGSRADLFAWVTLANGDETSFVDAGTQAVAGRVNHQPMQRRGRWGGAIQLQCWPQQTTSDLPYDDGAADDIVVTGSRMAFVAAATPPPPPPPAAPMMAMEAQQEELGDFKLYRIPERVTVAPQPEAGGLSPAQQCAGRDHLPPAAPHAAGLGSVATRAGYPNRSQERLGIPLPAGRLILFGLGRERPILLGEGRCRTGRWAKS